MAGAWMARPDGCECVTQEARNSRKSQEDRELFEEKLEIQYIFG